LKYGGLNLAGIHDYEIQPRIVSFTMKTKID